MTFPKDNKPETPAQASRRPHVLRAEDVIIDTRGYPSEGLLKGVQADLAWAFGRIATLEKPKWPRKPRLKTLITRVEAASGRQAAGVTFAPDGSRTIKIGADGEQAKSAAINTWDEIL